MLDILILLQANPTLKKITLEGIVTFGRLISHLKREIIQPQPINETNSGQPPTVLPQSISAFLSSSLSIPIDSMQDLWTIMKEHVWVLPLTPLNSDDYMLYKTYGWMHGLS